MPPISFFLISNGYKKMVIKQHFCTFGRNDRYRPRSLCPSTWSLGSHVNPCPPESAPFLPGCPGGVSRLARPKADPPAPRPVLLGLSRLGQACLSVSPRVRPVFKPRCFYLERASGIRLRLTTFSGPEGSPASSLAPPPPLLCFVPLHPYSTSHPT